MFSNNCSICLFDSDYNNNENNTNNTLILTNCLHLFCKDCIAPWLQSGKINCPNCREIIHENDYSECGIKYRSPELQEIVCNLINRNSEDLDELDYEYNELLTSADENDIVAEKAIHFGKVELCKLIKKSYNVIKKNYSKINGIVRSYTQDDPEIIDNIVNNEEIVSTIHGIILKNFKDYELLNIETGKHVNILNTFIVSNRLDRKRKREYNEKIYNEYRSEIVNCIDALKEI
jgi:hypothetical protein